MFIDHESKRIAPLRRSVMFSFVNGLHLAPMELQGEIPAISINRLLRSGAVV